MARDRKRAKQRQQRRSRSGRPAQSSPAPDATFPSLTQPVHENVSGELEHASGEVEEFDAALIAGSRAADAEDLDAEPDAGAEPKPDAPARTGSGAPPRSAPPAAKPKGWGPRVAAFMRASWAELQRVQWPDRRQVAQATGVVLGFVAVAGAYLGLADVVAQKVVDAIL